MIDWAKWLEISGLGMDILGVGIGGWYAGSKFAERVRRKADKKLPGSLQHAPKDHEANSSFGRNFDNFTNFSQSQADTDIETGAEELLGNRMAPWVDPFLDPILNWGLGIVDRLKPLGWLRIPLLAPLGLVVFALVAVLTVLLLPLAIVGYFFDIDDDFRLRLIVLAFVIGITLQIIKVMIPA